MPRVVQITSADMVVYSMSIHTSSPQAMFEFDLTDFRDPMGNVELMKECADGTNLLVQKWIKQDPRYVPIVEECLRLAHDQITTAKKSWLSYAFRDYHGKWKSRAMAEIAADALSDAGFKVAVIHAGR